MILDLVPENDPFLSEPIPSYNFGFGGASRPTRWMKWDKLEASELAKILIENMYHHNGIGLSANQIGIPSRVFSMLVDDTPIVCFNPKILEESEEWIYEKEGCLSFPGLVLKIKRPKAIAVTYQDQDGQTMLASFSDLSSRCFCHEMEHMDGYTFLDHVSDIQLRAARKKQRLTLKKIKRNEKRNG